jgi:hypothetical protein
LTTFAICQQKRIGIFKLAGWLVKAEAAKKNTL